MKLDKSDLFAFYFFKKNQEREIKSILRQLEKLKSDEFKFNPEILTYYDLSILRIDIASKKEFSNWENHKIFLNNLYEKGDIESFKPIGLSLVYFGISDNPDKFPAPNKPVKAEFGNIWKVKSKGPVNNLFFSQLSEYIILSNKEKEKKSKQFIFSGNKGFLILESSLQKVKTEIREYYDVRPNLIESMNILDEETRTILNSLKDIHKQEEKIRDLTNKYISFTNKVSLVKKVQNTIEINIETYKSELKNLKLNDNNYSFNYLNNTKVASEQITRDLNYCYSTIENVQTCIDLLRGTNSIDLRKKSLNIQAGLAIVEISFIFYYSLGVWHLVVSEENWLLIPASIKLLIGGGLAVLIPIAAHLIVNERWVMPKNLTNLFSNKKLILLIISILIISIIIIALIITQIEQYF
ncbi:hypothetical protein [Methanobacterium oryzae]|uniref:hypothetical protein n=1 Tax=Methanobacterium oryzae TaxID=69540 RepID=UPI003D1D1AF9